jgi:SAM-dependent methyltransferase
MIISNETEFVHANYRELLIGCGNRRDKRVMLKDDDGTWCNLTTLDIDPEVNPDVVFDLNTLGAQKLPFDDDTFNELHAYDVLEHFGTQGDWRGFFAQFYEFWRVLKPGGLFFACLPHWESSWVWADPGHTRCLPREALVFLEQQQYAEQVGQTPMTDYRHVWKGNFQTAATNEDNPDVFQFVLRAIKE